MDNLIIIISGLVLVLAIQWWRTQRRLLPPSPVSLPFIGHLHLLGPLIHHSMRDLSRHYGPLFSLNLGSTQAIVVSSPDIAKEFLKTHELSFSSRMHTIATKRLTYNNSAYAFTPYGPYWKFVNKICVTGLLNPRALTQFYSIRSREINHFLSILARGSQNGTRVNVKQELMKLSYRVISNMMFGIGSSREDHQQGSDEASAIVREVTKIFGEFNVSDFVWVVKGLDLQKFRGRIEDIRFRYDSLLEGIIARREELRRNQKMGCGDEEVVKDFLDLLLDCMKDETNEVKITRDNVKALILDFITAATDTSAISIDWALAELMNNPRPLKAAQDEIDSVIGKDRLVEESDLPNLPYLQAVLKETFRLHPPIPMLMRKSTEPATVNGYHIPEESLVFFNIWAMGRDPKIWDSPMEFRPERFLKPNNGGGGPTGFLELRGQNYTLMPFGSGRRSCPGINLALQEVPTVLAALVQCFEWRPIDGSDADMSEQPGLTVPRAHDLVCVPVPRLELSKIIVA